MIYAVYIFLLAEYIFLVLFFNYFNCTSFSNISERLIFLSCFKHNILVIRFVLFVESFEVIEFYSQKSLICIF